MAVTKLMKPLEVNGQEIYPLTRADQVIMDTGERLNAAMTKYLVPDYTAADYGKLLGCGSRGLQWVDSLSDLTNAEEVAF